MEMILVDGQLRSNHNEYTTLLQKQRARGLFRIFMSPWREDVHPSVLYWCRFVHAYLQELCLITGSSCHEYVSPPIEGFASFVKGTPDAMVGSEDITESLLRTLWTELNTFVAEDIAVKAMTLRQWLDHHFPEWQDAGKLHFHLAEDTQNPQQPFAFLATVSIRVFGRPRLQHKPLGRFLEQVETGRPQFQALMKTLRGAAQQSVWLQTQLQEQKMSAASPLTAGEAWGFLQDVHAFEEQGIVVRCPQQWSAKKPQQAKVQVSFGGVEEEQSLNTQALLQFQVQVVIGDHTLSAQELQDLLLHEGQLVQFRGQWIQLDQKRVSSLLQQWHHMQELRQEGLSFAEAMKLLAGAGAVVQEQVVPMDDCLEYKASEALQSLLRQLQSPSPECVQQLDQTLSRSLQATLRPYQKQGVHWLTTMSELGLGGCLADDMGLGKTIQIISLWLCEKQKRPGPHLLVVPTSLLGNWQVELKKFAPSLVYDVVHHSQRSREGLQQGSVAHDVDVVITTYGTLMNLQWLRQMSWNLVVLDEAQAIKNPQARQSQAVYQLNARCRFVMTGTPVENRLSDLWALCHFFQKSLLGQQKQFQVLTDRMKEQKNYAPLRKLLQPYILRRKKTDRKIITDLPAKTDMKMYCHLSVSQIKLYKDVLKSLKQDMATQDEMGRRGAVLQSLLHLKQICNHPSQYTKDQAYESHESGKFIRLCELARSIHEAGEKVLIFTQYREMTDILQGVLRPIFGHQGLVLHGGLHAQQRQNLVETFQKDDGPSYFILTVKAGGTGLNLTQASHVIHFDRWWNPAAEMQATDRAYRIGQTRPVLVHKMICRGTVEQKIDAMIDAKMSLMTEVIEQDHEIPITEWSDDDIMSFVTLEHDGGSLDV